MSALRVSSLVPFVPSGKDYQASRRFFSELGFEEEWENDGYAGFRNGVARFILQKFEDEAFARNLMIRIDVEDLEAWWRTISEKRLEKRYRDFRIAPPKDFPWGREVHFIDPAGVCWHVGAGAGARTMNNNDIRTRDVHPSDLPVFFEQQLDLDAIRMAAFPARDKDAFAAHWEDVLADGAVTTKTILFEGRVAGYIVSFERSGRRLVGYWLGKGYWGRGIATRALSQFLDVVAVRPLYAHVARHNIASIRVLEKCGFRESGEEIGPAASDEVEEIIMVLGAS